MALLFLLHFHIDKDLYIHTFLDFSNKNDSYYILNVWVISWLIKISDDLSRPVFQNILIVIFFFTI